MSPQVGVALLAGAGVGVGLVLLVLAARGEPEGPPRPGRPRPTRRVSGRTLARVAGGVLAGVLVLLVTQWVPVALAMAAVVIFAPYLFGAAAEARQQMARLEALAAWVETMRDLTATGVALPEALPASVSTAAPPIRPQLARMAERLRDREPVDRTLLQLADDLDDPSADLAIAALSLNARAQGPRLQTVLSNLARSVRTELETRRQVDAQRRQIRRGVRVITAVVVVMALGLELFNPAFLAPYHSLVGQLVLTLVTGLFAAGIVWLRRLGRFVKPSRFLAAPPERRLTHPQAAGSPATAETSPRSPR